MAKRENLRQVTLLFTKSQYQKLEETAQLFNNVNENTGPIISTYDFIAMCARIGAAKVRQDLENPTDSCATPPLSTDTYYDGGGA